MRNGFIETLAKHTPKFGPETRNTQLIENTSLTILALFRTAA
jgi:hypothetical protein